MVWQLVLVQVAQVLLESAAQKAGSRLGDEIACQVFGSNTNSNLYVGLNREALEAISSIVKREIQQATLEDSNTKIEALKIQLEEYRVDPANNQFRLEEAILSSNYLVEKLEFLGSIGLGAYMLAANIRIAALMLRADLFPSEWNNVKKRLEDYSAHAQSMLPILINESWYTKIKNFDISSDSVVVIDGFNFGRIGYGEWPYNGYDMLVQVPTKYGPEGVLQGGKAQTGTGPDNERPYTYTYEFWEYVNQHSPAINPDVGVHYGYISNDEFLSMCNDYYNKTKQFLLEELNQSIQPIQSTIDKWLEAISRLA
jgi:hypothetical protein